MQSMLKITQRQTAKWRDNRIRIFVLLMLVIISLLIGYAYIRYNLLIMKKSYFEKIKFNSNDRMFRILNHEDKEILSGILGTTLAKEINSYPCLENHLKNDGSICIEWNTVARLYMSFHNMDMFRCYDLHWQALNSEFYPTDCYELSRNKSVWFGGSITKDIGSSLNNGNFDFEPFSTGDEQVKQFGNAIKRYFICSVGAAIQVNDLSPLYISINHTKNKFCLRAKNDNFVYANALTKHPELSYKICTTSDMRNLHMLMTQQSFWNGLTESDMKSLHLLIEEPVYTLPLRHKVINETSIYNFSEDIISMGFMGLGHILISEFWQENIGDFTVDLKRFPTFKDTIDVLHRRGFKIIFTIQPFISTDSLMFKEAFRKDFLIYERSTNQNVPALTHYKNVISAGLLDITNNATVFWLVEKLKKIKSEYQVDSFYLDIGTGYNLPYFYKCKEKLANTDIYGKLFALKMQNLGFVGISSASASIKPPGFLSVPKIESSWEGLEKLLGIVINYGIIGFPFMLPGPIGGDINFELSVKKSELPEKDLFVRWLQLVTFFPSMEYSYLPSEYKNEYVIKIAKELTIVRQKIVLPLIKKYLTETLNLGLPLVRPLWMLDPHDPACLIANDEFSLGEELIVAPVLKNSKIEREIYLPEGVWKDGIDGSLRKGNRWIHNYRVPKEKVAYFIKMPENTRF